MKGRWGRALRFPNTTRELPARTLVLAYGFACRPSSLAAGRPRRDAFRAMARRRQANGSRRKPWPRSRTSRRAGRQRGTRAPSAPVSRRARPRVVRRPRGRFGRKRCPIPTPEDRPRARLIPSPRATSVVPTRRRWTRPNIVPGRTPTSLLLPSSAVRLVSLPPENGTDKLTGDTFPARVIDHSNGADGTSILVNVDVAADQAATIAQLAAQDRIALVRDAGR